MTGLDLNAVQVAITDYVKARFPNIAVETGSVPSAESLPFVDGMLDPFIVLRFTDMLPASGGQSFGGPVYDEYYGYVDALCVGQTDDDARELATLVNMRLIGKTVPNGGTLKKAFGGGQYAIISEANRQPVAFMLPASFRYAINVDDVGAGSDLA